MATRKVKLTGIGYWAKVFEENRDLTGYEDALKDIGGQCTIDVDLDDAEMDKLKSSKSMLKGRESDENPGHTRVRFRRKWTENFGGGAPRVVKADNSIWDFDVDGFIGNGSVVEVILSVYDTSRKNIVGTRLEKVRVVEHVKYDREEEDATPTAKQAAPVKEPELNDEIPF